MSAPADNGTQRARLAAAGLMPVLIADSLFIAAGLALWVATGAWWWAVVGGALGALVLVPAVLRLPRDRAD